jgi:hypothetical protein
MAPRRAGILVIAFDVFFSVHRERLAALALRHFLPAVYAFRDLAAAGGLMSYGGSIAEVMQLIGVYTGRIAGNGRLSCAAACCAILLDAMTEDKLIDNRQNHQATTMW